MPALSTSNYGKGSPVTTSTDFADRLTAVVEAGIAAIDDLDRGSAAGAPVAQGSVNTLRKMVQDLGALATDVRTAASDEAAKDAEAGATTTSTTAGTSAPSGTSAAKS